MDGSHSLITSQIDTAPKLGMFDNTQNNRLITSQIDTAPKQILTPSAFATCLITSQIDTAPKLSRAVPCGDKV